MTNDKTTPVGQSRAPVERLAYTVTEAAEALGVSRRTMYNLIHKEGFPTLKVGRCRKISRELLEEWVRAQAQKQGGDSG